jgi:hypothetical protein
VGIRELFGDAVAIAETVDEATAAIRRLLDDEAHFASVTRRGIELVAARHTYAHRVAQVCRAIGLEPNR